MMSGFFVGAVARTRREVIYMFMVYELLVASPDSFVVRNPVLSVTQPALEEDTKQPLPLVHVLLVQGSGL